MSIEKALYTTCVLLSPMVHVPHQHCHGCVYSLSRTSQLNRFATNKILAAFRLRFRLCPLHKLGTMMARLEWVWLGLVRLGVVSFVVASAFLLLPDRSFRAFVGRKEMLKGKQANKHTWSKLLFVG